MRKTFLFWAMWQEVRRLFFSLLFTTILLACPVFSISASADSPSMVSIPGGSFQMGDSKGDGYWGELPVHTVTLDSFYIGKYEVTNQQYCDFLNSALGQSLITVTSNVVYKSGSGTSYPYCDTYQSSTYSQINWNGSAFSVRTKGGRIMTNDPMVMVSWYGSVAYCNWRSQQEGKEQCYNLSTWACDFNKHGYRLATEAEWEYAARGGLSGKRFAWVDPNITHGQANYYSSSSFFYDISPTRGFHPTWNDEIYPYTSPVGSFAANGYGLCDMAGNVWEWCNDWYLETYYSSSPVNNPTGPTSGSYRVLRGGGWIGSAYHCRVAYRDGYDPGYLGYDRYGFRVVLNAESPPPAKKRLIIDTDPAVGDSDPDDGTAIIYAFQSPELCTIEGITYGYGNFGHQIPESEPNIRGADRMLDYYQLQLNKIFEVLQEAGAIETAPPIYRGHKESETWDNNTNPPSNSAAEFIRNTVRNNPGQISVIALGTLTNIATAIAGYPDGNASDPNGFMRDCRELWIIGGGIGLGNVFDPWTLSIFSAEFNVWRDRIATEYVILHAIKDTNSVPKIKMVPLNATWRMLIDSQDISQFETDANPRLSNYLTFPMRWWIDEVHPFDCRQVADPNDPCDWVENGALAVARGYNHTGGQTSAVWLPGLISLGINWPSMTIEDLANIVVYMLSIEPAGAPSFPPYDTIGMVIALEKDDPNLNIISNDYKIFVDTTTGETIRNDNLNDREEVRVFVNYNNTEMTNKIISRWTETGHHQPPQNKKFIECSEADYFIRYYDSGYQFSGPWNVSFPEPWHTSFPDWGYYHLPVGLSSFTPSLSGPTYEGAMYRGRLIFDVNLPPNAFATNVKLHIYCDGKKDWSDPNHRASIYYCDPQENNAVDFWNSANEPNKYVDGSHIGTLQAWRTVNLGSNAVSKLQNVADGGQFAILLAEDDDDHPCAWLDTSKDWKAYLEVDFDIVNIIDFEDLAEFTDYWLLNCSSPIWCNSYDFDKSGLVNFTDFAELAEHWLEGTSP